MRTHRSLERSPRLLRCRDIARERGRIVRRKADLPARQIGKITRGRRQAKPIGQAIGQFEAPIRTNDHRQRWRSGEQCFETGVGGQRCQCLALCAQAPIEDRTRTDDEQSEHDTGNRGGRCRYLRHASPGRRIVH